MKDNEYLVGVYYFAGWWRELPNKWFTNGHDWCPDYPGRAPLLGEYNEQKTMDKEIAAAAKYGVDFFQFLWYPILDPRPETHADKLNEGLRTFLASPNNGQMRFTIEFVNHPPFSIATDEAWESACLLWCAAMKHPSYLRLDGRPVFKVHSMHHFLEQNGGDLGRVEKRLDVLKRIAKENGLQEPILGGGNALDKNEARPYQFISTYMAVPDLPSKPELYPYDPLLKHAEDSWLQCVAMTDKPCVPYVPAGWDPRPWKDPRPSFKMPTREEWLNALQRAKTALDKENRLGIPLKRGRQKMFLIYAWNEFGEGGIVAPTKGEGYMKLEGIKAVFGKK